MNSPRAPAIDDEPRKGSLGEIWAFLNQDVRTLKWGRHGKADPESNDMPLESSAQSEPPRTPVSEVVSEVDLRQVEGLQFRRELLDWRDEFHFQVTEAASQAKKQLAEQVEFELANLNFLRLRLLTKSASEVLAGHIESCVRSSMRRFVRVEQAALRQRLQDWLPHRQEEVSIWVMWPKPEWDTGLVLKFTADNREQILMALHELILGENGLADRHRQWATQYARQTLEMWNARPDSV